jgi:DNA-binding NarL/FixJ family response regulator
MMDDSPNINQKITVLLIEDNPGDAFLIKKALAYAEGHPPGLVCRYDLVCVDRLSSGLERLSQGGIDAVLLDLSLPDAQELESYLKVKRQASQIPIVVLTGLDDESLAVKMVQHGAQDYLLKREVSGPFLKRAVRYAIERERANAERKELVFELQAAMARIKVLQGLLPICSYCKMIRDSDGEWHQIDKYVAQHSEAEFSHGICPTCMRKQFEHLAG